MEVWKDIGGYEGVYQVSNYGNVRSLDRTVRGKNNCKKFKQGTLLKPCNNGRGRLQVTLYDDNRRARQCQISRLVGIAFLDNPNNYPEINHRDDCISNNRADNLEWCTRKYNINYGMRNQKSSKKRMKRIIATSLSDDSIILFESIKQVTEKGFSVSCVSDCLAGRSRTHKGYWWIYEKDAGKKSLIDCLLGSLL